MTMCNIDDQNTTLIFASNCIQAVYLNPILAWSMFQPIKKAHMKNELFLERVTLTQLHNFVHGCIGVDTYWTSWQARVLCVVAIWIFCHDTHCTLWKYRTNIFAQVMEETRNLISIHKIINRCQAISSVNNEECVKKSQDWKPGSKPYWHSIASCCRGQASQSSQLWYWLPPSVGARQQIHQTSMERSSAKNKSSKV